MVERKEQKVVGFQTPLNWFLFDCVFKPFAAGAILILERWYTHRLAWHGKTFTAEKIITAAQEQNKAQFGGEAYILTKAASLLAHFLEADNAYKVWFLGFTRRLAEKLQR